MNMIYYYFFFYYCVGSIVAIPIVAAIDQLLAATSPALVATLEVAAIDQFFQEGSEFCAGH